MKSSKWILSNCQSFQYSNFKDAIKIQSTAKLNIEKRQIPFQEEEVFAKKSCFVINQNIRRKTFSSESFITAKKIIKKDIAASLY